jgi:hypothetical protein
VDPVWRLPSGSAPRTKDSVRVIAAAIRRYLQAHPNASDTADAVARWWLSAEHVHASGEEVEEALEYLVGSGEVVKRRLSNGATVYGARHRPVPQPEK